MNERQGEKYDRGIAADLEKVRAEFPILEHCTYLISNSLGAVPRKVRDGLDRYYALWAEKGVTAWADEWWALSGKVGDKVAALIHAGENEVAMLANATIAHWAAMSTAFSKKNNRRTRIIMTELDFPSTIYAVSGIARSMGWDIDLVPSHGAPDIPWERIVERMDSKTLAVAVSHVWFKSAAILDVRAIAEKARSMGIFTVIDGYHAPGTIPVNVQDLGVDIYIGGCLKWLCGGPGNAFLYARPEYAQENPPLLTGWLAHQSPFRFSRDMEYTEGAYRFLSGTPPVPCLYTASAGLDIILDIGDQRIREKSRHQTGLIIHKALERGFHVYSPEEETRRGGAVSLGMPNSFQIKQALEKDGIKVDFRKGEKNEPDVIRVGPHFYTRDEEIDGFFQAVDDILTRGEYRSFSKKIDNVT